MSSLIRSRTHTEQEIWSLQLFSTLNHLAALIVLEMIFPRPRVPFKVVTSDILSHRGSWESILFFLQIIGFEERREV